MKTLFEQMNSCNLCVAQLPLPPRPIFQGSASARLLIIGQAPGIKAHQSGIPWNDASGERLRMWLGLTAETFYNEGMIAILPMGLCYPGRAKSGDKAPLRACAPRWHKEFIAALPNLRLTLLVGTYAQQYYLADKRSSTEIIKSWRDFLPHYLPLPHPSPRNNIWLAKNRWFENKVLPDIKPRIQDILKNT